MRLPWLADVLRGAGLSVRELDGWQGRGSELSSVFGLVCHHTATGPTAHDEVVAKILRDGRPDLKGPLAQLGLDRSGTYWLVADGKCSHNIGQWGNQAIGIEAFNDGRGEDWPTAQLDAWHKGCAAILRQLGLDHAYVKAHREVDPRRKIDPHGIDMGLFRTRVRAYMEDDDMFADPDRAKLAEIDLRVEAIQQMVADIQKALRDPLQPLVADGVAATEATPRWSWVRADPKYKP